MSEKKVYIKTFSSNIYSLNFEEKLDKKINEWVEKHSVFVLGIDCSIFQGNSTMYSFIKYQKLEKKELLTERVEKE